MSVCKGFCHYSVNYINFGRLLHLNELSYWPQLGLILKNCLCSLKWAQIELNCSFRLGDMSLRSYLLLMEKADNGLYHPPIKKWSCIKIRHAKHLNSFWLLITNPVSVQNRRRNQSNVNFNPTSKYDTCETHTHTHNLVKKSLSCFSSKLVFIFHRFSWVR